MPWFPDPFTGGVVWKDLPDTSTALDAANLNAEENAEAAYAVHLTQSAVNYFEAGQSATVLALGTPAPAGSAIGSQLTVRSDGTTGFLIGGGLTASAAGALLGTSGRTSTLVDPKLRDFVSVLDSTFAGGAVADAIQITDASMTAGSPVLNTARVFTTADQNKKIFVQGAGADQGVGQSPRTSLFLSTTILSVTGGVPTLADPAVTSVSGVTATFGTDNQPAFQAAYLTGRRVYYPQGDYLCASFVGNGSSATVPYNAFGDWKGRTRIFYGGSSRAVSVSAPNRGRGTAVALTANANAGDHILSITSTTGLKAGDFLVLSSTANWAYGAAHGENTPQGEIVRIQSVDSGTALTVYGPIIDTYLTVNTAAVQKMTYLDGHSIIGMEFRNAAGENIQANAGGGAGGVLSFDGCSNITVDKTKVEGHPGVGVQLQSCLFFDVNVDFVNGALGAGNVPGGGANSYGYGVDVTGATCFGTVRRSTSLRGHHSLFTTNADSNGLAGVPRFIDVVECTGYFPDTAPFHTHYTGEYINYIDCGAYGGAYKPYLSNWTSNHFFITGKNCKLIRPRSYGGFNTGIQLAGDNCEVHNPIIRGVNGGDATWNSGQAKGIAVDGANCKIERPDIDGVNGVAGDGIVINSSATGAEIVDAVVRNTSRHGINNADSTDSAVIDGFLGVNNGGYGIFTSVATPKTQYARTRVINPTSGLCNQPRAILDDQDGGWPGLIAPSTKNWPWGWSTFTSLAANTAYLLRIRPTRHMVITKIAWVVNTAASVNDPVDVGIYDEFGNRLGSLGSTLGLVNGTGVKIATLPTPIMLAAGAVYYAAFAYGALGGTIAQISGGSIASLSWGQMLATASGRFIPYAAIAASFPLPSTITLAAPATATFPVLGVRET